MSLSHLVTEFTPGAAGVWILVLLAAVHFTREWRETRKLSAADRQARREGYQQQVESLIGENRQQRLEMRSMAETHENYRRLCHQETDQLRDQVVALENRLAGVLRKIADVAVRAARGEVDAALAATILQLASEAEPRRMDDDR